MTKHSQPDTDGIFAAWGRFDHSLPEAALRAAVAHRETMTPFLLQRLERISLHPDRLNDPAEYWTSLYSLYVLASFREVRTLAPLRTALDVSGRDLAGLWGEDLAADAARLFASWAFADPDALKPFVDNPGYDDSLRSAALEAFLILHRQGAVDAGAMREYLRHLGDSVLRRDSNGADGWLWHVWALCCAEFAAAELHPLVRAAHDGGWMDAAVMPWPDRQRMLAGEGVEAMHYGDLIDDPAGELAGWHCFSDEARHDAENTARAESERDRLAQGGRYNLFHPRSTIVNRMPAAKPNQPCPCGSGKKYKKCCGR